MEVTPLQWQSWLDDLNLRLSTDEDFRRAFRATPGKAVGALGVPNEFIGSLIGEASRRFHHAALTDVGDAEPHAESERRWADLDDGSSTL